MTIPSQAIALVFALRAQGRSDADIRDLLAKPLTPRPYSLPWSGWFHAWRRRHAV